ncbi:hypothetical protein VVR46_12450 [Corynebacterium phoceense]|uniref:hypothetical protein n=1 Tax=Corynebacterium phoceense TaxID=1686286 RepID=UPI0034CDC744
MTTSFDFTGIMPYAVPFTPRAVGASWAQIVERYRRNSSPIAFQLDEGAHLVQVDWPGEGPLDVHFYADGAKIDSLTMSLPAGERTMPPMRVTAVAGKRTEARMWMSGVTQSELDAGLVATVTITPLPLYGTVDLTMG